MNEELYKENILEHYRNPHNRGVPDVYNIRGVAANPTCGDDVEIYLTLDSAGKVAEANFLGEGCAISQAATSMLTDKLKGMAMGEVKLLSPGDVYTMLGVRISPARVNCALLSYEALNRG